MKVLFVISGNKDKTSGLAVNQAVSIMQNDPSLVVDYYYVKGKGFLGYLKNVKPLKQKIKGYNPDVIHAHYSFCGFLSALSLTRKPIVTSLMGSDLHLKFHWRVILFFASLFWKAIIVKSEGMRKPYLLAKTQVIPNGVNLNKYPEISKEEARHQLKLKPGKLYVLFLADPARREKNFHLAEQAFKKLNLNNAELLVVHNIPHENTRLYYYAVDVVVMSSLYEGSPNVVKEAMVCNCPLVSTDVGDVRNLFEGLEGTYIAGFEVADYAQQLQKAIGFSKQQRTIGREKIVSMGLDSATVAKRITTLYKTLLS